MVFHSLGGGIWGIVVRHYIVTNPDEMASRGYCSLGGIPGLGWVEYHCLLSRVEHRIGAQIRKCDAKNPNTISKSAEVIAMNIGRILSVYAIS
ncbi:hypothetical protein GCM10027180_29010 [Microbulbifer echini]